jgi:hypothetical protein
LLKRIFYHVSGVHLECGKLPFFIPPGSLSCMHGGELPFFIPPVPSHVCMHDGGLQREQRSRYLSCPLVYILTTTQETFFVLRTSKCLHAPFPTTVSFLKEHIFFDSSRSVPEQLTSQLRAHTLLHCISRTGIMITLLMYS